MITDYANKYVPKNIYSEDVTASLKGFIVCSDNEDTHDSILINDVNIDLSSPATNYWDNDASAKLNVEGSSDHYCSGIYMNGIQVYVMIVVQN